MSQTAVALALGGISFLLTVIWGGPFIRILHLLKIGKQIRIEGPERHITKLGTPTMGGFMIVIPILIITGVLNLVTLVSPLDVIGRSILFPMLVMVAFALLGAIDDWQGVRGVRRGEGMRARWKFLFQILLALGAALVLKYGLQAPELILPSIPEIIDLGIWYVPLAMFVIVSSTNAVNLTDGLDGLAGLIAATAFAAYGVVAMLQGQVFLMRFCFTVVGALFAFLWYNVHPAELFMGDTGSLSIGATLGVVALMTGHWALLPVIAIIPVSVTASVILQIVYFRVTKGRRLFKMAPLQHHFELLGWSETQVVQRFWLVNLLAAMVGVAMALI
ncbi:MAG: phospho-N-acetylmuramoyl-pentapeptide-transferase [Chloroflexi bacterium RBG_13_68_17]|nr:MAG: phospho-N-acetylmuramoyl-pentapeptide-transferase [Chloroflexi bacterium RBG_13_68_17]